MASQSLLHLQLPVLCFEEDQCVSVSLGPFALLWVPLVFFSQFPLLFLHVPSRIGLSSKKAAPGD